MPVLRETSHVALQGGKASELAGFPMVPYANRIANGAFEWRGATVRIARNTPGEPHALHGVGWQCAWQVREARANGVCLELRHEGDADWPYRFVATQRIVLGERELRLTLSAQNCEKIPVPLAIGHHPYFHGEGASLLLRARYVWSMDDHLLPGSPEAPRGALDFSAGPTIAGRLVDNCSGPLLEPALISWRDRDYELKILPSANLPLAMVYIDQAFGAFCVEPMPHLPNSIAPGSSAWALGPVAPQAEFCAEIRYQLCSRAPT